jgi:hypothetical protein
VKVVFFWKDVLFFWRDIEGVLADVRLSPSCGERCVGAKRTSINIIA